MSEFDVIGSTGGSITIIGILFLIIRDLVKAKQNKNNGSIVTVEQCASKHLVIEREMGASGQNIDHMEKTLTSHTEKLDKILLGLLIVKGKESNRE